MIGPSDSIGPSDTSVSYMRGSSARIDYSDIVACIACKGECTIYDIWFTYGIAKKEDRLRVRGLLSTLCKQGLVYKDRYMNQVTYTTGET